MQPFEWGDPIVPEDDDWEELRDQRLSETKEELESKLQDAGFLNTNIDDIS